MHIGRIISAIFITLRLEKRNMYCVGFPFGDDLSLDMIGSDEIYCVIAIHFCTDVFALMSLISLGTMRGTL